MANILFTLELARRLAETRVTVNVLHPGPVRSGFGMDGDITGLMGLGNKVVRPFEIGPAAGAKTSVYLASSTEVARKSGQYWVRCKPGHMSKLARSDEEASRLWSVSEHLLQESGFDAAF